MGLDMYLNARRTFYSWGPESNEEIANKMTELLPELAGRINHWNEPVTVESVTVEIAYWRKANQIHNWFVTNIQDGEDNCKRYFVERGQLKSLRDTCQKVLDDNMLARILLPTTSGCFFGSTDYDESYFCDLENTIGQIDEALTLPDTWTFEYQSSW